MSFQLIYEEDEEGKIFSPFRNDADAMRAVGICVGTRPSAEASTLLRRGSVIDEKEFPIDPRYLQNGRIYGCYAYIHRWYSRIENLTIPTIFCDDLGPVSIAAIQARGWDRAFVKDAVKSLVEDDPLESVWPDVSFEVMRQKFSTTKRGGPYALRQYLPPETFEAERRYWVIDSQIHHSRGEIPDIVTEAAERLRQFGGIFYAIDATPDLIVEINAGESSDRKTDNRAEDFARWIQRAFDS